MKYKFIRTGTKPLKESAAEFEIRECLNACTPKVKARLEAFFKDAGRESVTFRFEGQTVTVKREGK